MNSLTPRVMDAVRSVVPLVPVIGATAQYPEEAEAVVRVTVESTGQADPDRYGFGREAVVVRCECSSREDNASRAEHLAGRLVAGLPPLLDGDPVLEAAYAEVGPADEIGESRHRVDAVLEGGWLRPRQLEN